MKRRESGKLSDIKKDDILTKQLNILGLAEEDYSYDKSDESDGYHWTKAEEEYLQREYPSCKKPVNSFLRKFNKTFGTKRTMFALTSKLKKLNVYKINRHTWTDEYIDFLHNTYYTFKGNRKEYANYFNKTNNTDFTVNALAIKAAIINKSRVTNPKDKDVNMIHSCEFWTEQLCNFVVENVNCKEDYEKVAKAIQECTGRNVTWASVCTVFSNCRKNKLIYWSDNLGTRRLDKDMADKFLQWLQDPVNRKYIDNETLTRAGRDKVCEKYFWKISTDLLNQALKDFISAGMLSFEEIEEERPVKEVEEIVELSFTPTEVKIEEPKKSFFKKLLNSIGNKLASI